MIRFQIGRYPTTDLTNRKLKPGQLALDIDRQQLYVGDGARLGGHPLGATPSLIETMLNDGFGTLSLESIQGLVSVLSEKASFSAYIDTDSTLTDNLQTKASVEALNQLNASLTGLCEKGYVEPLLDSKLDLSALVYLQNQVARKIGAAEFELALSDKADYRMLQSVRLLTQEKALLSELEALEGDVQKKQDTASLNSTLQTKVTREALFSGGIIRREALPDDVDDVLEFDALNAFPSTGVTGRIYVDSSTNLIYRWSGQQYIGLAMPELQKTASEEALMTMVSQDLLVAPSTLPIFFDMLGIKQAAGQWFVDGGEAGIPGFVMNSGPGPEVLTFGDKTDGFFGIVPNAEMISVLNLTDQVGLIQGSVIGLDTDWIKFIQDGIVKFVPTKPLRNRVSWNDIYAIGAVYGTDDVGVTPAATPVVQNAKAVFNRDGKSHFFKVRLPAVSTLEQTYIGAVPDEINAEWQRLMRHLASPAIEGVETWRAFTAEELAFNTGYAPVLSDSTTNGYTFGIGNGSALKFGHITKSGRSSTYYWRPLLEVIPSNQVDFVTEIRDVQGTSGTMPGITTVNMGALDSEHSIKRIDAVNATNTEPSPASISEVSQLDSGLTATSSYHRVNDDLEQTDVKWTTTE